MRGESEAIEGAADFDSGELRASSTLGPAGEFEDGGDMAEVADLGVAGGELDGVADEPAGGGKREGGEGGGGDEDDAVRAG